MGTGHFREAISMAQDHRCRGNAFTKASSAWILSSAMSRHGLHGNPEFKNAGKRSDAVLLLCDSAQDVRNSCRSRRWPAAAVRRARCGRHADG